ncbi:hypothetical protein Glove_120g153 [Diversispora epigaea]|uniref:Uncharacterized protein n=1 Tax=Diversispora epigaea TaxID=1348612 RepID=A0A397J679_9GLOM|nr:hypothetical protein Glove_120g153 [Diversispora epigaea]
MPQSEHPTQPTLTLPELIMEKNTQTIRIKPLRNYGNGRGILIANLSEINNATQGDDNNKPLRRKLPTNLSRRINVNPIKTTTTRLYWKNPKTPGNTQLNKRGGKGIQGIIHKKGEERKNEYIIKNKSNGPGKKGMVRVKKILKRNSIQQMEFKSALFSDRYKNEATINTLTNLLRDIAKKEIT